ncbi:protein unc-93 homolog A-like isoform X3 [Phyllobates terribilis]|uniref:protein unc-93 homolog A-like isoform X3 n=1 Tax=Phyllobates terribilis TaxID=111132 RepID=UPI003CCB5BE4
MAKHLVNILVVSFGFLLLFTAFGGLQSLQSSLNADEGLGVASLSIIYGALIISSVFVPPILIKKIGCKWTIVASMCCYITYSLGNFYPSWYLVGICSRNSEKMEVYREELWMSKIIMKWDQMRQKGYTLIPTSVILGFGGAPLWAAKCTYLTVSGNRYAEKVGKVGKDIVNQYFGLFFLIFQSSGVWGNLISSLIFGLTPNEGSGVLAVLLVSVFLDNMDVKKKDDEVDIKNEPFRMKILETLRHLKDKRQVLLIPLTMWSGFEQGFLAGDYTKSYVTCSLGIHFVGYVMICFASTNAICSLLFGKLSQYTGRIFLFTFAALTNLAVIIALLLWKPHPNQLAMFFIFPALWGMADAIWQTQTNALYGLLFDEHKEAGFANYRLWESLGFVIAYGYSTFLCVSVKLYILLAVLVFGMALYGCVEYYEYKKKSDKVIKQESDESMNKQTVM